MSQQINLYDPALLRQREWLTAANLAAASLALLAVVAAWGGWERISLGALESEDQGVAPQVKAAQDQMTALGKQLGEAKPDPRLEAELTSARDLLDLHGRIADVLKKGLGGGAPDFAEYMRALARQSQGGLWLTGFGIAEGGGAIEIRGRMTDAALLPEYIRRLNGEKVFQGRAFAALNVSAPPPEEPAGGQPNAAAQTAAQNAAPPPYLEFVLTPVGASAGGDASAKGPEGRR